METYIILLRGISPGRPLYTHRTPDRDWGVLSSLRITLPTHMDCTVLQLGPRQSQAQSHRSSLGHGLCLDLRSKLRHEVPSDGTAGDWTGVC